MTHGGDDEVKVDDMGSTEIDDDLIWNLAHKLHPIMGPFNEATVERVLACSDIPRGARILDLGGRRSFWLLQALESNPTATGVAVESCAEHAVWTRAEAERRGIGERLEVRVGTIDSIDLSVPDQGYDLVLSVWAVLDALGGLTPTLKFLRPLVGHEGKAVLGMGFWEREPSAEVLDFLELQLDAITDLSGTVRRFTEGGWVPVYGHVSGTDEWDDFVWSCVSALAERAYDDDGGFEQMETLKYALGYRDGYLDYYRRVLGFTTFVMRPWPRRSPSLSPA